MHVQWTVDWCSGPLVFHPFTHFLPAENNGEVFTSPGAVVLNSEYHLRAIKNAVWEARAKWKEIGLELRFSKNDLATLTGDAGAKLERVLLMWMHRGGATIDQLLDVLRSDRVRMHNLADKIEKTRDPRARKELGLQ